jgi:hypothetical protein
MQKHSRQRGLPVPDEASAKQHCLRKGVDTPDLAMVNDFFRFYIATSRSKLVEKPTADSICSGREQQSAVDCWKLRTKCQQRRATRRVWRY